jgi:photosystem II stability/assembly factor-like uncharacterized protein
MHGKNLTRLVRIPERSDCIVIEAHLGASMKSAPLILVVLIFLGWAREGCTQDWARTQGASQPLNAFAFPEPQIGFAVGDAGAISKTTDQGRTWTPLTSGTSASLKAVHFVNQRVGYAAGGWEIGGRIILKTSNGGVKWDSIYASPLWYFTSLQFVNAEVGHAAGPEGIVRTINGGATWIPLANGPAGWPTSVYFINADTGFAASRDSGSSIFKTMDGGKTWSRFIFENRQLGLGRAGSISSFYFVTPQIGFAIGGGAYDSVASNYQGAVLLKTTDGGTTWSTRLEGVNATLNAVDFYSTSEGWAVGSQGLPQGVVLKTTDGGESWSVKTPPPLGSGDLKAMKAFDRNSAITLGDGLLATTNGGNTWDSLGLKILARDLNATHFLNADTGYVTGNGGKFLRTEDGGKNWTWNGPQSVLDLHDVMFFDFDTGYVLGKRFRPGHYPGDGDYTYELYKTVNRGENWISMSHGGGSVQHTADMVHSSFFVDASLGYLAGSRYIVRNPREGFILKTTNGGNTWITLPPSPIFSKIHFVNADTGFGIGSTSISKTVNGGQSWTPQHTEVGRNLQSLYFLNANVGYIVGDSGTVLKTIDGGSHWINQSLPDKVNLKSVFLTGQNTGWITGESGLILRTADIGAPWFRKSSVSGTSGILSVHCGSPLACYAAGNSGLILKFTDTAIASTILPSRNNSVTLAEWTTGKHFHFELVKSATVRARVFDYRGRMQPTQWNGTYRAGKHILDLNSLNAHSGPYILDFQIDGFRRSIRIKMNR